MYYLLRLAPKTLAAKDGIGTIKNVFNAQQDGHLLMVCALLFQMSAPLSTPTASALLATKATTWSADHACYLRKQDQLTLDAKDGTGTTRDAFNAQQDGCSDQAESA